MTPQEHHDAIEAAIGRYADGAAAARAAIERAAAAGVYVEHTLDQGLPAGAHIVSRVYWRPETDL